MAVIRTTYQYRNYPDLPYATFVSKHTHKPSSCFAIGALSGSILLVVAVLVYNAANKGQGFWGIIADILMIVSFLAILSGVFWVPRLSDALKLDERVAKREKKRYAPYRKPTHTPQANQPKILFSDTWVCTTCGTKNSTNFSQCKNCGKFKS